MDASIRTVVCATGVNLLLCVPLVGEGDGKRCLFTRGSSFAAFIRVCLCLKAWVAVLAHANAMRYVRAAYIHAYIHKNRDLL